MTTYFNNTYDSQFYEQEIISRVEDKHEKIIDNASDQLLGVVENLYGEGELNISLIEYNLGELARLLNVKLPDHTITVSRNK